MKQIKRLVLAALIVCMLPISAFAAYPRGKVVPCVVTDEELQSFDITLIDEDKTQTTEDGSSSSEVESEDEDVEHKLPSLVFGDDYIEINGVRYPIGIVTSATSLEDVTSEMIQAAADDESVKVYKQTLGIDGDVFGRILEDLPTGLDFSEIISKIESIMDRLKAENEAKGKWKIPWEEFEKQIKGAMLSGKSIQGMIDAIYKKLIDWINDQTVMVTKFDKEGFLAACDEVERINTRNYQIRGLIDSKAELGDVQVIPTEYVVNNSSHDGDSGLTFDVGERTFTFVAETPEYEQNKTLVKTVTQDIMPKTPIDVVAGKLATGHFTVDGKTSALKEYMDGVKNGTRQEDPAAFVAALKKDKPLIEAYYYAAAADEEGSGSGVKRDIYGNITGLDASYYSQASGKLTIPFDQDAAELMATKMEISEGKAGIIGWNADKRIIGNEEWEEIANEVAQRGAERADQESAKSSTEWQGKLYYLTEEENDERQTYRWALIDAGVLTYANGKYALADDRYGEKWVEKLKDNPYIDPTLDPEFLDNVIEYWTDEEISVDGDKERAGTVLGAAREMKRLAGVNQEREAKDPLNEQSDAEYYAAHEEQSDYMTSLCNYVFNENGTYATTKSTFPDGTPSKAQMDAYGLGEGGYEITISIPNTTENKPAIESMNRYAEAVRELREAEARWNNGSQNVTDLPDDVQKARESVAQAEADMFSTPIYDSNGIQVDNSEMVNAVVSFCDSNPTAILTSAGSTNNDNGGYMVRQGGEVTGSWEDGSLAVTGKQYRILPFTAIYSLSQIPEEADQPMTDEDYQALTAMSSKDLIAGAISDTENGEVKLQEQKGKLDAKKAELKEAKESFDNYKKEQYGDKEPTSNDWISDPFLNDYGIRIQGLQKEVDALESDVSRREKWFADGSTEPVGQEWKIANNGMFEYTNEKGEKVVVFDYDKVNMNNSDGSFVIPSEDQLKSRTGDRVFGWFLAGAFENDSNTQRENWGTFEFDGGYYAGSAETNGFSGYVLPDDQSGVGIYKDGVLYALDIKSTEDVKRMALASYGLYVMASPSGRIVDDNFLIIDEERANQWESIIPKDLRPYISQKVVVAGSDEPFSYVFDYTAWLEDHPEQTVDPNDFNHKYDTPMMDVLMDLSDGKILEALKLKRLKPSGDGSEKLGDSETTEDMAMDALEYIYTSFINSGDDLDDYPWYMYTDIIEAARQLLPDLRKTEERKRDREEAEEKQRESEEGSDDGDTTDDGGEDGEDGDKKPETSEEVRTRLSRELVEYLVSLGIAESEIPDNITMQWLKERIGVEEIKKFFKDKTVMVDHYVTVRVEDIKVVDSETKTLGSYLFGIYPLKWSIENINNGVSSGEKFSFGGMIRQVQLYSDLTLVNAIAKFRMNRTIKVYYSVEETLVVQPFGWVISKKSIGGSGVDGEDLLLNKTTQIVEIEETVKSWSFEIEGKKTQEEKDKEKDSTQIIGDITTVLRIMSQGGYWINGFNYDTNGIIEVTINGTSDPDLTFRIY